MSSSIDFTDNGKVLGPADGIEAHPAYGWINASCSMVDELSIEQALSNLRQLYPALLTSCPQLRLQLVTHNNHLYWAFSKTEEIAFDDLIRTVDPPKEGSPKSFSLDKHPLWRVEIYSKNGKKWLRLYVSHGLTDGTGTFALLELFISIAEKKHIPQRFIDAGSCSIITSFRKNELFEKDIAENVKIPESWNHFIKMDLYPEVTLHSHAINTCWSAPLAPVDQFCKKHSVSVQALLMALHERTVRAYHQGRIDSVPLGIYIPVDTRHSPGALPQHRANLFYPSIGHIIPFVTKQNTLLEDILHCKTQLRASLKSTDPVYSYLFQASLLDPTTLEATLPEKFPHVYRCNLVFASNVGLVCEGRDVEFGLLSPVDENGYWPSLYSFTNGKTLTFMFVHPFNFDQKYLETLRDTFEELMAFINQDLQS